MFESIILGAIQGLAEWLPISSEAMIVLAKTNLFHSTETIRSTIEIALFLHLGTFFAALIYLRKDVMRILATLFSYRKSLPDDKRLLGFLVWTTLTSGVLGILLVLLLGTLEQYVTYAGQLTTLVIGILLLVTAYLQFRAPKGGSRTIRESTQGDVALLGAMQGLAVLPGFSRSGFTISTLLLRGFSDTEALRLSFLMSLPIVLGGNIVMPFLSKGQLLILSPDMLWGLVAAFIFGLITIHGLLQLAKKINFSYFLLFFGLLMIVAAVVT